ncbi:acyl-CoA desaturase, partial [Escherichia coli]
MADPGDVRTGDVLWAPAKSLWITAMFTGAVVGGSLTLSWSAVVVFVALSLLVLL